MSRRWPKDWKPAPFPPVKKKKEESPVAVDMAKGDDFTSYILAVKDALDDQNKLLFSGRAQGKSLAMSGAAHALKFEDIVAMRDRLLFEPKRRARAGYESFEKYRGWLARIKYKDGFTFEVSPDGFQLRLHISMACVCVDDKRPTKIYGSWALDADMNEYDFVMFVRRQIHDLELHEADEWLKYDFVNVFNPHNRRCRNDFEISYDEHESRAQFDRTKGEREYRRHKIDSRNDSMRVRPMIVDECASMSPTLFERYPWER